jgi:hypothetical protein
LLKLFYDAITCDLKNVDIFVFAYPAHCMCNTQKGIN